MIEYQRVIAEIDLDAIASNIREIRSITDKSVQIMGIVKADAYGHGAVEVAKTLLYNGADWLGVAMLDEAVQLRKNNIHVPILILGYTPEQRLGELAEYGVISTVFSYDTAKRLSECAQRQGLTAVIHIKLDTGMGRIGFAPNAASYDEIEMIARLPNIEIDGIYTHFSTSDEADKTFTYKQLSMFKEAVEALRSRGMVFKTIHCANSAGVMDFDCDGFGFNMARPGIILYGLYPSGDVAADRLALRPAMSIKTRVSYIKRVPAGSPIGYGRAFITERESVIATVPVGYADGFIRRMSAGGRVIVGGEYAPVVGRVCMDQFMVDITGIDGVEAGDEVILMGKCGKKEITADEIARVLDTISYEVVCMIGKRVPREYIKNGKVIKTVNYIR